jgi:hypothetical protein
LAAPERNSRSRAFVVGFLRAVLLLVGAFSAAPSLAQQFSAEIVYTGLDSILPPGRIYVSRTHVRIEDDPDMRDVYLADVGSGAAFILDNKNHAYINLPGLGALYQVLVPQNPKDPCPQWHLMPKDGYSPELGVWTCVRVGAEKINGRSTIKYALSSNEGERLTAWIDETLRFAVKFESRNDGLPGASGGLEVRDILEGAQPQELFLLPDEYQKIELPEKALKKRSRT